MKKTSQKNRHAAFTLVELLIVLIIIGVLAALAIPNFIGTRSTANELSAKKMLQVLGADGTAVRHSGFGRRRHSELC